MPGARASRPLTAYSNPASRTCPKYFNSLMPKAGGDTRAPLGAGFPRLRTPRPTGAPTTRRRGLGRATRWERLGCVPPHPGPEGEGEPFRRASGGRRAGCGFASDKGWEDVRARGDARPPRHAEAWTPNAGGANRPYRCMAARSWEQRVLLAPGAFVYSLADFLSVMNEAKRVHRLG